MTGRHTLPTCRIFLCKKKSQVLNCHISSSLKQISMKVHIFSKFSMENLRMDRSCFSFHLKISDILKRDVISNKGY